jgi:hypothetical protein
MGIGRYVARELDGRSREFYEFTEIDKHSNKVNAYYFTTFNYSKILRLKSENRKVQPN